MKRQLRQHGACSRERREPQMVAQRNGHYSPWPSMIDTSSLALGGFQSGAVE